MCSLNAVEHRFLIAVHGWILNRKLMHINIKCNLRNSSSIHQYPYNLNSYFHSRASKMRIPTSHAPPAQHQLPCGTVNSTAVWLVTSTHLPVSALEYKLYNPSFNLITDVLYGWTLRSTSCILGWLPSLKGHRVESDQIAMLYHHGRFLLYIFCPLVCYI